MCNRKENDHPSALPARQPQPEREPFDGFSEDFCAAMDSGIMPIYIIDPETFDVLYCNHAMRRALGRDATGDKCYKSVRGKDAPCESCTAMRLYRHGDSSPKEFLHPLGSWVLLQPSPLRWQGRDLINITCVDITHRKRMEQELRLRNKEYAAVVRQSAMGVMRYDIAGDTATVNVNRRLERVEEHAIPAFTEHLFHSGVVGAQSVEMLKALISDVRGGMPSKGYTVQLCVGEGDMRWCRVDYALIEDDTGEPNRAVISFFDNTEQHEKELAYQNWNARLNSLTSEHMSYMEVNLNQDCIELENHLGTRVHQARQRRFSEFVEQAAQFGTYREDIRAFQRFFNRERLLGLYYAGRQEDSLECRIVVDNSPCWYRVELQMVSDPYINEVKASIVFNDVDADVRERERLTHEAEHDALTGLYNRAAAERLIRQTLAEHTGERYCFLLIDLDDLRGINSALGHPEGDRALKAIADAMIARFRKGDILGRIGGDEFVVLLRDVPDASGLHAVVSGFMRKLSEIKIGTLDDRSVHVSVGGTIGTAGVDDFSALYKQADLALYYTKATGKNAFNFYMPEMENREFSYEPHSTATMTRTNWYESKEFGKLLQAMAAFFPLVISVNLTQNTYYMMEYMAYTTQKAPDEGSFDQLIVDGASVFHPDDRESFLQCFQRENLLRAHAEGKRMVYHKGRQLGDDGVYRSVRTIVVFVEDETSDDVYEITFAHVGSPKLQALE